MEVEEVQSRSASMVHRHGQNVSAAHTTAAFPESRIFITVVHKQRMCLPLPQLSQQSPSTFQPPRVLLRSAQQYRCRQM